MSYRQRKRRRERLNRKPDAPRSGVGVRPVGPSVRPVVAAAPVVRPVGVGKRPKWLPAPTRLWRNPVRNGVAFNAQRVQNNYRLAGVMPLNSFSRTSYVRRFHSAPLTLAQLVGAKSLSGRKPVPLVQRSGSVPSLAALRKAPVRKVLYPGLASKHVVLTRHSDSVPRVSPNCKPRPGNSRGNGSSRAFVPWCR